MKELVAILVLAALPLGQAHGAEKPAKYQLDDGRDEPDSQQPQGEAAGANDEGARRILERFRSEPSVREVQEAALRYAQIDGGRVESWRRRASAAGIGPQLTAEYRRNVEDDRTLGAQSSGNVDYSALDDDHRFVARARWDLDRLIFNPEELRVSSENTSLVKLREDVLDQVTKVYFERRRLQVELVDEADAATRVRKELRLQELTASIDALTGGWFSDKTKEQASGAR